MMVVSRNQTGPEQFKIGPINGEVNP